MSYLISLLAAAAGIVVLSMVVVRLRGRARRLSDTVHRDRAHLAHRAGTLTAQIAALRVALRRRRRNGAGSRPAPTA